LFLRNKKDDKDISHLVHN